MMIWSRKSFAYKFLTPGELNSVQTLISFFKSIESIKRYLQDRKNISEQIKNKF